MEDQGFGRVSGVATDTEFRNGHNAEGSKSLRSFSQPPTVPAIFVRRDRTTAQGLKASALYVRQSHEIGCAYA